MLIPVVQKAADAVGGVSRLAKQLDCKRQALHQWDEVPRGRVLEIEEITLGAVQRHEMRPDIYPPPKEGAEA